MVLDDILEKFNPRILEEVCKGETYNIRLLGHNYCKLAINKKNIDCQYLCKVVDQNGMRPCIYNKINK